METRVVGRAVIAPLLTSASLRDPRLRRRLDALVRSHSLGDDIAHVKLWSSDGRVLYATEPQLIGNRYALGDDEREVLKTLGNDAEVPDLTAPENRFERREGKLLEVYAALRAGGGAHVLFETYRPYSLISRNEDRLRATFGPALVAAVLLLALLTLPLVLGLARRLERGRREREALLRRALDASGRERQRVARDLHDGPVQRLAGVAFSLGGAERACDGFLHRDAIRAGAEQIRETIRELRGTLTDLYPLALERQGLAALGDMLAPLRARGISTELDLPRELVLDSEPQAALFRAAQEDTRNVLEHAHATHVRLAVAQHEGHATLELTDDGTGFSREQLPDGRFGLRLLDDLARDVHGSFEVQSQPGRGTRVRFEVPT